MQKIRMQCLRLDQVKGNLSLNDHSNTDLLKSRSEQEQRVVVKLLAVRLDSTATLLKL